eukprot:4319433-Amphidinium_carterae.1
MANDRRCLGAYTVHRCGGVRGCVCVCVQKFVLSIPMIGKRDRFKRSSRLEGVSSGPCLLCQLKGTGWGRKHCEGGVDKFADFHSLLPDIGTKRLTTKSYSHKTVAQELTY